MAKKTGGKLDSALEDAIAEELKEATKRDDGGKFIYNTMERMRVIDRALKLQSIKLKADNPEYGSNFSKEN